MFVDVEDILAGVPAGDREFVARRLGDGKMSKAEAVAHSRRAIVNTVIVAEALCGHPKRIYAVERTAKVLDISEQTVWRALRELRGTDHIRTLEAALRGGPAALGQLDGRAAFGILLAAMQVQHHEAILAYDIGRLKSK
jgi:hypothetical protein